MTSPPTIFISYTHDSPEHRARVLDMANRLRADGIDVALDQYVDSPPEGWPRWMDRHILEDDFVLVVCSEIYLQRATGQKVAAGEGLGAKWESYLTYQHIYNSESMNTRFIPILFNDAAFANIPTPLQGVTHYHIEVQQDYDDLYRRLTNQPARVCKPPLGQIKTVSLIEGKTTHNEVKVSLAKLPSTSPILFGRDLELKSIDDGLKSEKTKIITLVAWAGVGKTALVNKWLSQVERDSYRGAKRVFGWSFYSQGSADGRQISSDLFITNALSWFGDPHPTNGTPWEKGERLADLIKQKPTILILDGLEPLQYPPPIDTGRIKDPALCSLLRELAYHNQGLVVVTSRLPVDDLKDFLDNSVQQIDLENLSSEAGAKYLSSFGIKGPEDELKLASSEYDGHALALTLLGSYLKVVYDGDIYQRNKITRLTEEKRRGSHVQRIMASYEKWFKGNPELDILYLLSLFDRPIEEEVLTTLKSQSIIPGLTENIFKIPIVDWQYAIDSLRSVRLISIRNITTSELLDFHPLLREYFSNKLIINNPKGWQEAHSRLYDYYKSKIKSIPKALDEMVPHFSAVSHGCHAGRFQEAYDEIYFGQINKHEQGSITKVLGSPSAELTLLSNFFESYWDRPISGLKISDKGSILNNASNALMYLGRLKEAITPAKIALELNYETKNWRNASVESSNISTQLLALGDIKTALDYAKQGVVFSNRSTDGYVKSGSRAAFAAVLHRAGRFELAETQFRNAEMFQKKQQPLRPLLFSSHGFDYCSLLLSQGKYLEVKDRSYKILEWFKQDSVSHPQTIAFIHLSLGRAIFQQITEEKTGDYSKVIPYFELAVKWLRLSGAREFHLQALLARGNLYQVLEEYPKSLKDINEAFTFVKHSGMHLYEVDCYLGYASLYLALGDSIQSKKNLHEAKQLITKMGYHQRDNDFKRLVDSQLRNNK